MLTLTNKLCHQSGTEREDEDLWPLDREEILALATGTAHRNASPSFAAPSERESGSGEWTKLAKSTSRTGTNAYIGHVQARGWAGQVLSCQLTTSMLVIVRLKFSKKRAI